MSPLVKTLFAIASAASYSLVYLISSLLGRQRWAQNRRFIFIGEQQLRLVYILLGITFPASVFLLINQVNFISLSVYFLQLLIFLLVRLKHLVFADIFVAICIALLVLGQRNAFIPPRAWYTITLFVLSIYNLLLLISVMTDKHMFRQPWNEIEVYLRRKGYQDDMVEEFHQQWLQNQQGNDSGANA